MQPHMSKNLSNSRLAGHVVDVQILPDSPEFIPVYKTSGSAACDLRANIPADETGRRVVTVMPNQVEVIDAGFSMVIPHGWEAQIRARSGLSTRGLQVTNSPGTIDSDYIGRIKVIVNNTSKNIINISHLERFAQMLIKPVWQINWNQVDKIELETERGAGGFGSTGSD